MSLMNIYTDHVRPDQLFRYEELIGELARAAREGGEEMAWTAHQVTFGPVGKIYYVINAESHAELERRGDAAALFERVLGDGGRKALGEVQACLLSSERSISTARLDLSYPADAPPVAAPLASIARIQARNGGENDVEELFRKLAEATAKLGDAGSVAVSQRLTGDMSEYVVARPLQSLAELDTQPIGKDALVGAFGRAEGQRVFRAASQSIQSAEREILALREELSNIPA